MNPLLMMPGAGDPAPEGAPPDTDAGGDGDDDLSPDFEGDFDADRAKRAITKLRTESKSQKAAMAEMRDKAEKFDALSDANKSDSEKLTEKVTSSEQRATTAEARADRLEVAIEKGLTLNEAQRLVGGTKEELLADADVFLSDIGERKTTNGGAPPPRTRIKTDLRPTGGSQEEPDELDPAKLAKSIGRF